MTTTLGLTSSATCAVLRPVPLVALMELPVLSVLLSELAGRSTCWMTTLLPPPYFAPTKPPAKPMAAASTSATALRASFPPLNFFFLRRGFSGCCGALYCGCSGGVGGTLPPSAGAVYAGRAGCASGSLYWFAVFMPLLPTLG